MSGCTTVLSPPVAWEGTGAGSLRKKIHGCPQKSTGTVSRSCHSLAPSDDFDTPPNRQTGNLVFSSVREKHNRY